MKGVRWAFLRGFLRTGRGLGEEVGTVGGGSGGFLVVGMGGGAHCQVLRSLGGGSLGVEERSSLGLEGEGES